MTTAKLFMNGRSQAVRLPKGFHFPDQKEVLIKRMGDVVMLFPKSKWKDMFATAIRTFPDDVNFERMDQLPERD